MEPFKGVRSIATPLDKINVDTDQIVPKQFLKLVQRSGFGRYLFYDWRYEGDAGGAGGRGRPRPDFVLNDPRYDGSSILVTGENFGCGSSREHAVWALADYGFRAIIAPSFADIFYSNCLKNGMLPVTLGRDAVREVREFGGEVEVSLEDTEIRLYGRSHCSDGEGSSGSGGSGSRDLSPVRVIRFEIEAHRRAILLEGLDEIAQTLKYEDEISRFEDAMARRVGAAPPMA